MAPKNRGPTNGKSNISATKRKEPIGDSIVAQGKLNKAAVLCIPQEVIALFGIAFVLRSGHSRALHVM